MEHDSNFVINRPRGSGDYVFLHFTTPINIHVKDGRRLVPGNSCVLYAPGFPQWYSGITAGFVHHWIHFSVTDNNSLPHTFAIPENRILHLLNTNYIPIILEEIRLELSRKAPFWEEAVEMLLSGLFLQVHRNLARQTKTFATPYKAEQWKKLMQICSLIEDKPQQFQTVKQMAQMMHLSESRFTALFREFLGHSPMEAVIRARLNKACWLLTNTTQSIKNVAEQCGCENVYYFSRLFRRRIGCPPREYYKRFIP